MITLPCLFWDSLLGRGHTGQQERRDGPSRSNTGRHDPSVSGRDDLVGPDDPTLSAVNITRQQSRDIANQKKGYNLLLFYSLFCVDSWATLTARQLGVGWCLQTFSDGFSRTTDIDKK